jgi:Mn-dependent DtxR family transcriptional regulator
MAKKVKKQPTLAERVIKALAAYKNGATTDKLAQRVRAKGASVSSVCSRLKKAGKLVRKDAGGGRGTEALWALAA